jgi:hypothetical protein
MSREKEIKKNSVWKRKEREREREKEKNKRKEKKREKKERGKARNICCSVCLGLPCTGFNQSIVGLSPLSDTT